MTKTTTTIVSLILLACGAHGQGALTPPGAPTPTMKTLQQVEPRIDVATLAGDGNYHHVISESGSYYLSGNLDVTLTGGGIKINAPAVTLDLNGFKIERISGSGGSGIEIPTGMDGAMVRNGTINGFKYGISGSSADNCLFEKLAVSACSFNGIYAGSGSRLNNCQAHNNTGNGIRAGNGSVITGCMVKDNGSSSSFGGIYAGSGSTIRGCSVYNSASNYSAGITTEGASTISDCIANDNLASGISGGPATTISGCTASYNLNYGIYTASGASISRCTAQGNSGNSGISTGLKSSIMGCTANHNQGSGIEADEGAVVKNCTASGNHGSDGIRVNDGSIVESCTVNDNEGYTLSSFGIRVDNGCSVIQCIVRGNSNTNSSSSVTQGTGIYTSSGSTVKDCTVSINQGDGIRVYGDCTVSGNTCDNNGNGVAGDGAGIHVLSTDNRIEGNTISDNDRGIDVDSFGNLIIRNSATGSLNNYEIVANNKVGTIVSAPSSAAISGSTGGSGVGTTDPWANFSF